MFRNYFKVALRNLLKNKVYTIINLVGLGLAITASLFLFKYVDYEKSFDRFHVNSENIYRVTSHWNRGTVKDDKRAITVPWTGPGAKELFPEIREFGRLAPASTFIGKKLIEFEDIKMSESRVYFSDPGFLKMFSFEFVRGSAATALNDPYSLVLTESMVNKYFKSPDDIMGKTVNIAMEKQLPQDVYKVTAIVKDLPANSHIQFDVLISFNSMYAEFFNGSAWWHWDYSYNYLWLKDDADPVALGKKMTAERERLFKDQMADFRDKIEFEMQPLHDIHLHSHLKSEMGKNGDGSLLSLLVIIGIFILVIGYINYINIAVAKSFERSREIGVRKTYGAERPQLIAQFVVEALVVNIFSVLISWLLTPYFESVLDASFTIRGSGYIKIGLFVLLMIGFGTLVSGLYPAFILSSFKPVMALKESLGRVGGGRLRKVLVIGQFVAAILLLCGAITVFRQMSYMKDHELGMNLENTLVLEGLGSYSYNKYTVLQSELLKHRSIEAVSSVSTIPGDELGLVAATLIKRNGEKTNAMAIVLADTDIFKLLEVDMLAGRTFNFSSEMDQKSIILNEAAAQLIGYTNPGSAVNNFVLWDPGAWGNGGVQTQIIGVVRNYYQRSVKEQYKPIVYLPLKFFNVNWTRQYYVVKYRDNEVANVISSSKAEWNKLFPGDPFHYFFLEDHFNQLYKPEQQFGNIFTLFTFLAIVIAAMGLYGLSSFIILKRSKEIAIRKVLSASTRNIFTMLAVDYLKLVLIAYLVAIPLGYWLVSGWLDNYPNRVSIGAWFFVLPLVFIVLIALASISFQILRAAAQSPVRAMKNV
jgi:putative ABC transport system permease protein